MAPSATVQVASHEGANGHSKKATSNGLKKSGALDSKFPYLENTPAIGREYGSTNIVDDLLNAPDADDLLRDLAITSKHLVP
jgi:hypothetical protein